MPDQHTACVSCGTDVRNARRFKDGAGRLFCTACAEQLRSRAPAPAKAAPSSPPAPEPDDGTIALADEPTPAKHSTKSPYADLEICPDCGTPFGSGPVCLKCGHDRRTGESIGVNVPGPAGEPPLQKPKRKPPKPCMQCGYDLTGLKTARCPECGTINPRLARGQQSPKQLLRDMYIKPLIMIAICVPLAALIYAAFGGMASKSGTGAGYAALGYLAFYVASVPIGFLTYIGCSVLFIGFDEPLTVTFVRLAGVYAVTDACAAVLSGIPVVGWIIWPIQGLIYVSLLMSVMELDFEDAWIVSGVTFIVHMVLWFVIAFVVGAYF